MTDGLMVDNTSCTCYVRLVMVCSIHVKNLRYVVRVTCYIVLEAKACRICDRVPYIVRLLFV